jgi:hypothetical protein
MCEHDPTLKSRRGALGLIRAVISVGAPPGLQRAQRAKIGDADFVLAGGVKAEPSNPRPNKKSRPSGIVLAATIVTLMGGDASERLRRLRSLSD